VARIAPAEVSGSTTCEAPMSSVLGGVVLRRCRDAAMHAAAAAAAALGLTAAAGGRAATGGLPARTCFNTGK